MTLTRIAKYIALPGKEIPRQGKGLILSTFFQQLFSQLKLGVFRGV